MPLRFESNRGQTDSRVQFISRGQGYTLFLTSSEAVLTLAKQSASQNLLNAKPDGEQHSAARAVVRLQLLGANQQPVITREDELPAKSNYLIGNDPSKWRTNIPNYARVRYSNIYPGIDLVYYGNQRQLENDFVVSPGADPSAITLAIRGANALHLDSEGNLVIQTAAGDLRLLRPNIYQMVDGRRHEVSGHYLLKAANQVGFTIARFDHGQPLIIDPVLTYSTYLGGGGNDIGYGIALDSGGNAYLTGLTDSSNFPLKNALQSHAYGAHYVFVSKLAADGSALVYSTYLGGSIDDQAYAIAVDKSGAAYITGQTASSDFPVTSGAFQQSYAGGAWDAFVSKIAPDGSSLLYSTYLGGGVGSGAYSWSCNLDIGRAIAVDANGNAYVTGQTCSADFPTKNALQNSYPIGYNNTSQGSAFVTAITADGSDLIYSTYLTGTSATIGYGIAVDSVGDAYVTGYTVAADFPIKNGPQKTVRGAEDAFVTALKADGSDYIYSTYLGGNGTDVGRGIAVDSDGNAYVTGYTQSTNFPVNNPFQSSSKSNQNAFVTKVASDGLAFTYSTYLGGSCGDAGWGIAVDAGGYAYVGGAACSADFPVKDAVQGIPGGNYDVFVTKLGQDGSSLVYSTYLGGPGLDGAYGIAIDSSGDAFVTGTTNYTNFPTEKAFQGTYGGGASDAFVAKISESATTPVLSLSSNSLTFSATESGSNPTGQSFDITNTGAGSLDWTHRRSNPGWGSICQRAQRPQPFMFR